jgi:hypothetical protein
MSTCHFRRSEISQNHTSDYAYQDLAHIAAGRSSMWRAVARLFVQIQAGGTDGSRSLDLDARIK